MAQFKTMWTNPPEERGVTNFPPSIVQLGGFVDPKEQIESFFRAGRQLEQARSEAYDFPDGQETGEPMPRTRSPGIDMAEISMINRETTERIEAQKKANRAKNAQERAEKTAEKIPPEGGE